MHRKTSCTWALWCFLHSFAQMTPSFRVIISLERAFSMGRGSRCFEEELEEGFGPYLYLWTLHPICIVFRTIPSHSRRKKTRRNLKQCSRQQQQFSGTEATWARTKINGKVRARPWSRKNTGVTSASGGRSPCPSLVRPPHSSCHRRGVLSPGQTSNKGLNLLCKVAQSPYCRP